MKCWRCGREVRDDATFCGNCGAHTGKRKEQLFSFCFSVSSAVVIIALIMNLQGGSISKKSSSSPSSQQIQAQTGNVQSIPATKNAESGTAGTQSSTPAFNETTVPETTAAQTDTESDIHRYEYYVDDCSWNEAFYRARSLGGYLARINTYQEYEYIKADIRQQHKEKIMFRVGARRDPGSSLYYWVDINNSPVIGPINVRDYWAFPEWMSGEPSFSDKDLNIEEEYVDIYFFEKEKRWVFNDVPDDIVAAVPNYSGRIGYIVEYD